MKKRPLMLILIMVGVLLVLDMVPVICNQANGTFYSLNETDQAVLTELNTYISAESEHRTWDGYDLCEKPIFAVNGSFGKAFLVNAGQDIHSIFAKEIAMPADYSIRVYRVSAFAPQMFQFMGIANFNTIGSSHSVFGNDVYYTKYNDASISKRQDSGHYITFLAHEAFHYYMQNSWAGGERFDTSILTDKDLDLMEKQYTVFAKIYAELEDAESSKEALSSMAKEYVNIMEERMRENPTYMERESLSETVEGTATYIGLKASEHVNYDFQIMHFVDEKLGSEVIVFPFDAVVPLIKSGEMDRSMIASNCIYQTGALLCEMMDELEIPDWQQKLNAQTLESPVSLYSIIRDYVNTESSAQGSSNR